MSFCNMTVSRLDGWAVRGVLVCTALLTAYPSNRLTAQLPAQDTIPTGYGTLRRDDVAVRITTDRVDIQVLPLREGIIRLLAPDTYRSLSTLIRNRQATIDSLAQQVGTRHPTLVLVTFVGLLPQARFNPEDVNLASGGQLFRPIGIAPASATWGSYQLGAQEQASAIYLFDEGITLREDLIISYQTRSTTAWNRSVRILDQERQRVESRMRASAPPQ